MAVGYASGRVELWNLETGLFVAELSRHRGPVINAVIADTTAGLRVSTTALIDLVEHEGAVRTLDDPAQLRETLCAISDRDLSAAEWRRFVGEGEPRPCARGL